MKEARVQSLVHNPTCRGACVPQLLKPASPRACALQQRSRCNEKHTPHLESSPCLPQQKPSTAKNKANKQKQKPSKHHYDYKVSWDPASSFFKHLQWLPAPLPTLPISPTAVCLPNRPEGSRLQTLVLADPAA